MNKKAYTPSIAVAFCALYKDWIDNRERILESFCNLRTGFQNDCYFFLMIQGAGKNTLEIPPADDVKVCYLTVSGISLARNKCIEEANGINCRWLIFHDATIYWPESSASFIYANRSSIYPPKVKLEFNDIGNEVGEPDKGNVKKLNPIYDTYVGAILFELKTIAALSFNEDHGPGEKTKYKSGEDVLFAFGYFSQRGSFLVLEASSLYVFHPPRPESYSKHLTYARGQGRMFKILLTHHFSLRVLLDSILFFGNGLYRCILLRKNSFTILQDRLAGFFMRYK